MIIYLDEYLIDSRNIEPSFNEFLGNIMLAYKEGKHLIIISPKKTKELIEDPNIDNQTKILLINYSYHNKAALAMLQYFSVIIKIIPSHELETVYTNFSTKIEYRNIRLIKFLDSSNIQKTILLGENGSDSDVYSTFAEYYRLEKQLTSFKLQYRRQSGGGDPTCEEYKEIYRLENEFCLCILDSDKRSPMHGLGATAKKVKKFHDEIILNKKNYKCQYYILKCLEVENLIPKEFYINQYGMDPNKQDIYYKIEYLEAIDKTIKHYFDYKKGIKIFPEDDENSKNGYFFKIISKTTLIPTQAGDKHMYIGGYGENILIDFLKYDRSALFKHLQYTIELRKEWLDLGKFICSFILGTEKRRAI